MRHDLKWFQETLVNLIWSHFDLMPNKELEVKQKTTEEGQEGEGEEAKAEEEQ